MSTEARAGSSPICPDRSGLGDDDGTHARIVAAMLAFAALAGMAGSTRSAYMSLRSESFIANPSGSEALATRMRQKRACAKTRYL